MSANRVEPLVGELQVCPALRPPIRCMPPPNKRAARSMPSGPPGSKYLRDGKPLQPRRRDLRRNCSRSMLDFERSRAEPMYLCFRGHYANPLSREQGRTAIGPFQVGAALVPPQPAFCDGALDPDAKSSPLPPALTRHISPASSGRRARDISCFFALVVGDSSAPDPQATTSQHVRDHAASSSSRAKHIANDSQDKDITLLSW